MEEVVFKHNILMVNINKNVVNQDIYDAARFAWKVSLNKVEQVEYVLAVVQGRVVGVFKPLEWKLALNENFPEFNHDDIPDRYAFIGVEAPEEIIQQYLDKAIPMEFRKKGASNPVKYHML